jgi:hypothetical protein
MKEQEEEGRRRRRKEGTQTNYTCKCWEFLVIG